MRFLGALLSIVPFCIDLATPLEATRAELAAFYRDESRELINDEYIVGLRRKYTLDAHFKFLGFNLSSTASHFDYIPELDIYSIRLDSYMIHKLVRYDPGVEFVEQSQYVKVPAVVKEDVPNDGWSNIFRRWARVHHSNYDWNLRMISKWGKLPTWVRDGDFVSSHHPPPS